MRYKLWRNSLKIVALILLWFVFFFLESKVVYAGCNSFACCGFHGGICSAVCKTSAGWYSSCHADRCERRTSQYCNWNGATCVWQNHPYFGCSNNVTCYKCSCRSEPPCNPGPSIPKSACREKSTFNSCTYYVCSSGGSCSRTPRTKRVSTAVSNPPKCEIDLPKTVRFNGIYSGIYKASTFDRGDMFRINAFGYSTRDCGTVVYEDEKTREFPKELPFIFRSMDCSDAGYNRPRDYQDRIAFKTAAGSQVENSLDANNLCHITVTSEVKNIGPSEDVFVNQCSRKISVYYPPTFALKVELVDRNKESVEKLDGRKAYKLVQDSLVDWVGGVGDDPLQFLKEPDVETLLQKGICELLQDTHNYEYRVGDANPFWLKLTFWDENGPEDFEVDRQDVYLVNSVSGQEYPINRGQGDVQNVMLGLSNVDLASRKRAPATEGFTLYNLSGSLSRTYRTCLENGNILCAMRFKVEDVPGSIIRQILLNIDKNHPAYKVKDGLSSQIVANPPIGKKVFLRVYQKNLPDGKYFIRVRTKDREGAKYAEDFKNVNFLVDNTLPKVEPVLTAFDADTLEFQITVTDNNKLPTKKGPAFFAPYAFVEKRDGTKYFLNILDPETKKATRFKLAGTIFGNTIASNGTLVNISHLLRMATKDNGHTQVIKLYIAGPEGLELSGGDSIYYGVCVYDVAGNIKCTQDDLCSLPHITPDGVGNNWIKTSLNNVYSKGGFDGLPDYHQLLNIREYPVLGRGSKIKKLFVDYLAPFNSSRATLGNFSMVLNTNSFGGIVWGFNGNFFDNENPKGVGLRRRKINVDPTTYNYMASLAKDRCTYRLEDCFITVIDGEQVSDVNVSFRNAVESLANKYKVIYMKNAKVNVNGILKCKNANVIFVENSTIRIKGQVMKSLVVDDNLNPFVDYSEGCLFVLADGSNNKIILDDDPKQSATIMGNNLSRTDKDSTDTDFMQLAIIAFGAQEGQVTVKQTPRKAYKYKGSYDALIIHGFIYSRGVPIFERDLVFADNTRFPSEWIIFDPSLLQLYEPLLGKYKIQTFKCGVNNHPLCKPD